MSAAVSPAGDRLFPLTGSWSNGTTPVSQAGHEGSIPSDSTTHCSPPIEAVGTNRRATDSECVVRFHGWAPHVSVRTQHTRIDDRNTAAGSFFHNAAPLRSFSVAARVRRVSHHTGPWSIGRTPVWLAGDEGSIPSGSTLRTEKRTPPHFEDSSSNSLRTVSRLPSNSLRTISELPADNDAVRQLGSRPATPGARGQHPPASPKSS